MKILGRPDNGSIGTLENRIRTYCVDNDIDPGEFREVMLDLTGRAQYNDPAEQI